MDTLSAYLAPDRLHAVARGVALPDRTSGTALFADISGFTPLAAALAHELGPQRGAEELTRQLNRVYGALIADVERYHGSVISFSGDAITCWFDAGTAAEAALALSLERAVASALAMQSAISQFAKITTPSGTLFSLRIKVAISAGTCRRFLVGNPQIQLIDVLAGALLDRIAIAEQYTYPGEICVGGEEVALLGSLLQVRAWRTTAYGSVLAVVGGLAHQVALPPLAPPLQLDATAARPWVLPPMYARLQRGEGRYLSELRSSVALFLKFSGINYDQDVAAGARLNAFVQWVQARLAQYEGHLLQLTVGDKGSYLYAAFGAPIAHEDDAARAVAAALALQALPPELNFIHELRMGISQGQMRAGEYGGPTRRTYGVLGNDVNIAARLMSAAEPGQILITERIAAPVAPLYDCAELGAFTLKGQPQPVTVWAIRGARAGHQPDVLKGRQLTPLVGRAAEQAVLAERLAALLHGQAATVLIEGAAGIGKSRLVADLVARAQALHIPTLLGAAEAIEQATPYYAWRPIMRELLGLNEATDTASAQEQLFAQLPPDMHARAPLLNPVLQLSLPDTELTAELTGEVRNSNTQELLVSLLVSAPRPMPQLMIVLEDAHWLDSASWALVALVQRAIPQLLLVIVSRPLDTDDTSLGAAANKDYQRLLEAPDVQRLPLSALSPNDAIMLVCQRLGVVQLPPTVAELIQQRAEGHPFFSEELAYALRDAGMIRIQAGQCILEPNASLQLLDFPQTIQGIVTSRIDRLPPSQQLTLKIASVIGRIFLHRALHDIHPVENDRAYLREYLSTLERLDITALEQPDPNLTYLFKHAITQEVAYNMLLFAQRWQLHQLVAEWYEHTFADDLSPYYPLLAHHWWQAVAQRQFEPQLVLRAIAALEHAGEQALRNYANREAVRFFSQLLELDRSLDAAQNPTDHRRRAGWEQQLGEAYQNLGQLVESRAHLERALVLLGQPFPSSPQALLAGLAQQVRLQVQHRLRPTTVQATTPDARAEALAMAKVYKLLSPLFYVLNQTGALLYTLLQAVNLAERAGPSRELAEAYAGMCIAAGIIPLHNLAETYAQLAETTARASGSPHTLGFVLSRVSIYYMGTGKWEKLDQGCEQAQGIFAQLGDWTRRGESLAIWRSSLERRGAFAQGNKLTEELDSMARRVNHTQHQVWARAQRASNAFYSGQPALAIEHAEMVLAMLADSSIADLPPVIIAHGLIARAQVLQGNYTAARAAADAAAAYMLKSSRPVASTLGGLIGMTEAYIRLWAKARAAHDRSAAELQTQARQACRIFQRFARVYPVAQPSFWLYQGHYAQVAGRSAQASQAWQKAWLFGQQLAMPYEQALAHFELGFHSPAYDPMRRLHLTHARDLFATLGVEYDLQRTERVLQGTMVQ